MKIYTAATFSEQKRIRANKERLIQLGHSVLSTWLEEQIKPAGMLQEQFDKKMAANRAPNGAYLRNNSSSKLIIASTVPGSP